MPTVVAMRPSSLNRSIISRAFPIGLCAVLVALLNPSVAQAEDATLEAYPAIEPQPTVRVAVLPVTLLQPAGSQSTQIAIGVELMLHHALGAYAACNVLDPHEVREALRPFDLTGGPGNEALLQIAQELEADYVICTTMRFASRLELTGWWYRAQDAQPIHRAIVAEAPISAPMRRMTRFVETLAYRPAEVAEIAESASDEEQSEEHAPPQPVLPRDAEAEEAFSAGRVSEYVPTLMQLATAKLHVLRDELGRARSAFERAAAIEAEAPGLLLGTAHVTIRELLADPSGPSEGEIEEAGQALARVLEERPKAWYPRWFEANLSVARALRAQAKGDEAAAAEAWHAADERLRDLLADRSNAFAAWELLLATVKPALIAAAAEDEETQKAARHRLREAAEELVAAYPDRGAAHRAAARGLQATEQHEAARQLLRGRWTGSRRSAHLYGELLQEAGRHSAAHSVYQYTTVHHPHDRRAYTGIVHALAHEVVALLDENGSGTLGAEEIAQLPELAAAIDEEQAELDADALLAYLPALGHGPFVYVGRDVALEPAHELVTRLWHAALASRALTPQSAEVDPWVTRFLGSPAAEARLDELRHSYSHFLEVVQAGEEESETDLRPYLLVAWHLHRETGDDAAAMTLAREVLRKGMRVESVLAALYPQRDPRQRYLPAIDQLPPDELGDE